MAEGTYTERESTNAGIGLPVRYGSVESIAQRIKEGGEAKKPGPGAASSPPRTWRQASEALTAAYGRVLGGAR